MDGKKMVGIGLIVVGALMLAYGQFSFTTTETVADIGPLQVTETDETTIPFSPIIGGLAIALGAGVLLMGGKK